MTPSRVRNPDYPQIRCWEIPLPSGVTPMQSVTLSIGPGATTLRMMIGAGQTLADCRAVLAHWGDLLAGLTEAEVAAP